MRPPDEMPVVEGIKMCAPAVEFAESLLGWLRGLRKGDKVELARRGEYVNVTVGPRIACRLWYPVKRLTVEFPRCRSIAPRVPRPYRIFIEEGRRGQALRGAPPAIALPVAQWYFKEKVAPKLPKARKAIAKKKEETNA